jgi:hypothetical protein
MGMDFVALMKYPGPDERVLRVIDRLEAGSPEEVRALARVLDARGFRYSLEGSAFWEFTSREEMRDPRLGRRPVLPTTDVALWLPEGFRLTFGQDAVEVYHLLRWLFFLREPDLRQPMLDACVCLGRLFGATDCIITSDQSPVVQAFYEGRGFDAALASAGPEDGERPALGDLYTESPEDYLLREITLADGRIRTQTKDWEPGRPPPEGWERATTWDSRGYWRLAVGSGLPGPLAAWVAEQGACRVATAPFDDSSWGTCGEPDALLDHLFREGEVSRRKVLLWACACLRRIWPRLRSEPARRAVEVVERFADGQVEVRAVENAKGQVGRVKKGNRRGNHAAWRLAEWASGVYRFPPGDVSEAAVDAVVGDGDRAAERAEQADLLRDVFGPHPLRPITVEPSWRTPAVVSVARAAYEERDLPAGTLDRERLAVLADALEEAGCTDSDLLGHLRGPGLHVRGCFALDLLLGKG